MNISIKKRDLDVTYNGTIKAINVDITTKDAHCGALATDCGEDTVVVKNAKFRNIKSNGHSIYYAKSRNASLNGKTIKLPGGGRLMAK